MASTKFNKVKDVLIEALRAGMPKSQACALCGIRRETLYHWLKRGENGEAEYVNISNAIKKAQAEFVDTAIKKIKEAGDNKQWTAYAWLLERLFPEEFSRVDKVALTDPTGEKETQVFKNEAITELKKISKRELREITKLLESNGANGKKADVSEN